MTKRPLKLHGPDAMPGRWGRRAFWLGLVGGLLSRWLGPRPTPVTGRELRNHDYPASTQRMGVRFTERIRATFRFRWLRKRP